MLAIVARRCNNLLNGLRWGLGLRVRLIDGRIQWRYLRYGTSPPLLSIGGGRNIFRFSLCLAVVTLFVRSSLRYLLLPQWREYARHVVYVVSWPIHRLFIVAKVFDRYRSRAFGLLRLESHLVLASRLGIVDPPSPETCHNCRGRIWWSYSLLPSHYWT